ncbi:UNVERIFIED_CONTAM: hypothetical protein Sangu_3250900 [Sesamum angustifolium]|uniref:Endonuclease/exonuclease/phosphatase domain-containing protein n=1 Tax=Sesamum angustifolium TaxID=2727405 RepID=A0AAW2JEG9_9LAMI
MFEGSMALITNERLNNCVESQFVHCRAFNKRLHTRCLITVLYGAYDLIPRRNLWSALCNLSAVTLNEPWLVLGDFNAVMDDSEVYGRAADTSASMTEFRICIRDSGLVQLPFTGCPFTWHNCSDGPRSLWKRLDRMLANTNWMDAWPSSSYISALPSTSDHSPLILTGMNRGEEHVVFRFDNYLAHLPDFLNSVEEIWKHRIAGTAMYETVCKLKLLKPVFRQQKRLKGNLTDNNLLGGPRLHRRIDLEFLRHELKHTITTAEASLLVTPVTLSEVKEAFFAIDVESAPGPDGYTSAFFRNAWPVIGQAMFQAIASFSVSLNGSIHGFFKGGRGLRQGDPMSPYLFVLVMEIWNLLLRFRINEAADFQYHWKYNLLPSGAAGTATDPRLLGFQEGSLPVKYLGIPLTSSRLTIADCRPLIDKVDARLAGWNNQILSYAGRLQLIKSVLTTLHTYWASAFILPKGVLKTLEKKMRQFLWQGSAGSRNAKVAWAWITKPKEEGGLGIRSLTTTNQALMLKQLWRILQNDGTSIWVDWIQRYRLRHSTIWTFNGALGSWGWKKMLKLRPLLQRGVIYKIGDGSSFSLWQDAWHERGPLCLTFPQGPEVTGLPLSSSLSSVIQSNQWCWPASTDADIIGITSQLPPLHPSAADCISWRSSSGKFTFLAAVSLIQPTTPRVCLTGLIWASKRWRGPHLINAAFRATLAALVYHLWAERNNRKFSATSASAEYITSRVLDDIRMRILAAECPPSLQSITLYRIWHLTRPIGL